MCSMNEEAYLTAVKEKLETKISEVQATLTTNEADYKELKHYTIDYKNELDKYEVYNHHQNLKFLDSRSVLESNILNKLTYQKETPYFSKIAFQFDEETETEAFYIGRYGFADRYGEQLIYDWRAPISSLYYDFSLGEAFYESHDRRFHGKLRLKRQFEIKNGQIELMIDTNDAINDELLMRELGKSTSHEMKTIIHTIQREQNTAIRDTKTKNLVIQGVAGSGKTSIALHRMAYLLYQKKDELSASDILIVSPNQVFADYISTVLPELGEEELPQVDIVRLALLFLGEKYTVSDRQDELKEVLENPDSTQAQSYRYKQSSEFFHLMTRHFDTLKRQLAAEAITIEDQQISSEDITRFLAQQTEKSLLESIQAITYLMSKRVSEVRREAFAKKLTEIFKKRLGTTGTLTDYYRFLDRNDLSHASKNAPMRYADVFPFLYFKERISGIKPNKDIKHVVIDEMQDYSLLQLSVIESLFPCQKTICGDIHQTLTETDANFLQEIQSLLPDVRVLRFHTSYRSSYEIMEYAKRFIDGDDIQPVERHGNAVAVLPFSGELLKQKITEFKRSDYRSCGIICQSWQDVAIIEALLSEESVTRFEKETKRITEGIILTTIQFAKGLEFDQVILPDIRSHQLSQKSTRLYTSCSRALHELTLLIKDEGA